MVLHPLLLDLEIVLFFLYLTLPLGLVLAFQKFLGLRLRSDFLGVVANLGICLDDACMV